MNALKPAKLPIWERTKNEKKKSRRIKFFIFVVLTIIIVNFAFKIPGIYTEFNTPFPQLENDAEKITKLDTTFRTNVLLISYEKKRVVDLAIVSYEPVDRRLTAVLFNLSEYKKVRYMSNKEFRNGGEGALQNHLMVALGIPIDRYLAFEDPDLKFTRNILEESVKRIKSSAVFFKIFSIKKNLNNNLKTNFSTSELLKFGWILRSAKFDEKDSIALIEENITDLSDENVSNLINNLFFDRKILDEGASITIINATNIPGVGSALASFVVNLGGTVVSVEAAEEVEEKSTLEVKNKKGEITKRLESIITLKEKKIEVDFSGDLKITIGSDEAKELTLP